MQVRNYDITFIIRPGLDQATIIALVEKIKDIIDKMGAKVSRERSSKGVQPLAYTIDRADTGIYYTIFFQVESSKNSSKVIDKIEQFCRVNINILRFLTIALTKHSLSYYKEQAKMDLIKKTKKT